MKPRLRHAAALALVVVTAVAACQQAPADSLRASAGVSPEISPSPAASVATVATPAATPDRVAGWQSDLALIVPGMDRIHPDLTHGSTLESLNAAVTALSELVPGATDDELMVGVLRIVAMVSRAGCDGHTGAFIWGTGSYPVDSLPLRLWLFEDEVVVVAALPPYEDTIGSRIDTVGATPIAEVLAALDPLIPRDNSQTVRLLTPRFLLIPQVLRGLGLADAGPITLGLTSPSGATVRREVLPAHMAVYNEWAGEYGLHLPANPDVRYLSRIDDALWWELLPDASTLYVQYNRADPMPITALNDLRTALGQRDVARVVLDLRHNFGGELSALDPIVDLFTDPDVNQPDRLFVLTGRNTFSAGSLLVARLADTDAVIVGEPMGGCPTIFSDSSELLLPFSGIAVSVAGDTAVGVRADDPRLTIEPDLFATLTRDNWVDGRDPALEIVVLDAP